MVWISLESSESFHLWEAASERLVCIVSSSIIINDLWAVQKKKKKEHLFFSPDVENSGLTCCRTCLVGSWPQVSPVTPTLVLVTSCLFVLLYTFFFSPVTYLFGRQGYKERDTFCPLLCSHMTVPGWAWSIRPKLGARSCCFPRRINLELEHKGRRQDSNQHLCRMPASQVAVWPVLQLYLIWYE